MADRVDFFEKLLATNKAEALSWLRGSSEECERSLGEMDTPESVAFVEQIYALGAIKVWAVKLDDESRIQNSGHLVVELPQDIRQRAALFDYEAKHAESLGFCGATDENQPYLFFMLD